MLFEALTTFVVYVSKHPYKARAFREDPTLISRYGRLDARERELLRHERDMMQIELVALSLWEARAVIGATDRSDLETVGCLEESRRS